MDIIWKWRSGKKTSTWTINIRGEYYCKWTGELNSIITVEKKLVITIPRKNRWNFKAVGGLRCFPLNSVADFKRSKLRPAKLLVWKAADFLPWELKDQKFQGIAFLWKSLTMQLQDCALPCARKESASLKTTDHFCAKINSWDLPVCQCLLLEERWAMQFQRPLQNCGPL